MGDAFFVVFARIPSAVSIGIAGYLAVIGKDGWGWFLFIGLLLGSGTLRTGKSAELHAQAELERAKRGVSEEDKD